MSVAKIEEIYDVQAPQAEIAQCCDKHILVNPVVTVQEGDDISFINIRDFNAGLKLQRLQIILQEKQLVVANLERENGFLREQVNTLNALLEKLSKSMNNVAKNDIRIKVENASSFTFKKWYRRPKIVMSGAVVAVLFSIYLKYKIKNW